MASSLSVSSIASAASVSLSPRQLLFPRIASHVRRVGSSSAYRAGNAFFGGLRTSGNLGSVRKECIGRVSTNISTSCVSIHSCVAFDSNASGSSPKAALSEAFGDLRRTARQSVFARLRERFVEPSTGYPVGRVCVPRVSLHRAG